MTKAPNRTRPLDRDGDGADGGSLPGNQTAPLAGAHVEGVWVDEAEQIPLDELAAFRTTPGDSAEKLEAIEREVDEANAAARAAAEPDPSDTFTAEEIAAGRTPVIQAEGDAAVTAAEIATEIQPNDPLVQIETEAAPIAVRERELRLLVENRRLYKSAMPDGGWGYSSNYGAPYVDEATVLAWIAAGLAEDVPSAGNIGGVKPTDLARRQLSVIRQGAVA
ncbi:hypothetical protein ACFPIF_19540 [Brevundimonas faecalis]|uniref:hypothetical protein n=1 Tax=Brevundimonas faecalis TaxID=947378 RepID=UPI00361EA6B9